MLKDNAADNFYRAFEDKHRGPRELIKKRLGVYLPFVEPILAPYPEAQALDLGCGRGEWLELLSSTGFKVRGVDLDEGMLAACRDLGLNAEKRDALEALKSASDSSLTVVSAFHLVEHIGFDQLRALVAEALRVLVPGGLLIMETPNPENFVVAGCNFYLDPTHRRPIPPQLLAFLPEFYGFVRTKIIRLQESKELVSTPSPTLMDVLGGVSPDYAVVAQKDGPAEPLDALNAAFDAEYGLTLEVLVERYEARAGVVARQHNQERQAVYADRSWRLTQPLCWLNLQRKRLQQEGLRARAKAFFKKIMRRGQQGSH
jgi:O-antigen chain-terminating methyltransferase